MKLFYAFIFTISSTTLAFPQPDPINHQPDNIFKNENGILTFRKALELVPLDKNKLLDEKYPNREEGYLVVRDTKAENYFVVSDKAKDKVWSAKLNHIDYVVYKAMKYTKVDTNGTIGIIGQPVALKRYLEATCVNTEFPVSNEEERLKFMKMDEGDLIKVDTGKKGCFMPMKLVRGKTFLNLIVTGKFKVTGLLGKTQPDQLLNSIERELTSNGGLVDRDLHVEKGMINELDNFKISINGFGNVTFPAKKLNGGFPAWKWNGGIPAWKRKGLDEQQKKEMAVICSGLKKSLEVSLYFKGELGNRRRFEDALAEICLKRYGFFITSDKK